MNATILIGGYLGLIFFLCIFQAYIYLLYKRKSSLFYFLFTFSCAIGLLLEPGFTDQKLFSLPFSREINLITHLTVPLFGALFAINYLKVKSRRVHYYLLGTALAISGTLYLFHYLTADSFTFYLLAGDLIAVVILGFYFVYSFIHFSKSTSKFFIVGFIFTFAFSLDFFILKRLDFTLFNTSEFTLMLAGVLEALFTTFAVLYTLKNENQVMESKTSESLSGSHLSTVEELINQYRLSERENEVLQQILLGKSNSEIGEALFISLHTVKYHSKNLYTKLEVRNRKELFQRFL
ncbi:LuxR C-terminal-related transcriptional regulator [Jiulongibacter sediminis]|jgi:DNA-binding CsgD family transcriptional regulator|uniref:LuxR C-terminal-related transcriptional regulator n=1 Tax=Jiulongibacter sediminis TaxID=1605367 RepID=UPI0026EDEF9D|nr:LuxR C-terminal-related transcriptional regulator [Jiulongibacter sediminis]